MHGLLECALFSLGQVLEIWGEARCRLHMSLQKVSNGFIGIPAISAWKAPEGIRYQSLLRGGTALRQREIYSILIAISSECSDPSSVSPLSEHPVGTLRGDIL